MDAVRAGPRGKLYLLSVHTFAHVYDDTGELFVAPLPTPRGGSHRAI